MDQNQSSSNFSVLVPFVLAMAIVVALSNYLVQFPVQFFGLGEILTWGAFTYPFAFLVNDLTNRRFGAKAARTVVFVGFVLAVILSVWLASPRIAIASSAAFFVAQFLDLGIFSALRRAKWWQAPLISSVLGSAIDTVIFFSLAFAPLFAPIDLFFGNADNSLGFPAKIFGFPMPLYVSLAIGDFLVKLAIALAALVPYAILIRRFGAAPAKV